MDSKTILQGVDWFSLDESGEYPQLVAGSGCDAHAIGLPGANPELLNVLRGISPFRVGSGHGPYLAPYPIRMRTLRRGELLDIAQDNEDGEYEFAEAAE